jgi:hypothetical protein
MQNLIPGSLCLKSLLLNCFSVNLCVSVSLWCSVVAGGPQGTQRFTEGTEIHRENLFTTPLAGCFTKVALR